MRQLLALLAWTPAIPKEAQDLLCAVLALGLGVVGYSAQRRLRQAECDLQFIREGLKDLIRHGQLRRTLKVRTPLGRGIWSSILALTKRGTEGGDVRSLEELVQITTPITEAADEISQAGEAVMGLLREKLGTLVIGTAILWQEDLELRVQCIAGLPRARLEIPLLMSFEDILQSGFKTTSGFKWGYQVPLPGGSFDFSAFGVGASFITPLKNRTGAPQGVLWLGLGRRFGSLDAEKRALVHALAEHASAVFYAAQKVKARTEHTEQARDFLIGISHDLRAPGNSALYAVRELLHGEVGALSAEQHLSLKTIEQAIEDQLGILGDALDFAKHQRGRLIARRSTIPVCEALKRAAEPFQAQAAKRSISLSIEASDELRVLFDPAHFRRIITNLLSNAVKYTDQGGVTLVARSERGLVQVAVRDTGIGVPEAEEAALFEEFHRLTNGSQREGVGLGLALVRAFAELNGGKAFYERRPGGGSIFGIYAEPAADDVDSVPFRLSSIVVVDDDAAACRANIRSLREISEHQVPASSVSEALQLLLDLKPDLLITDYEIDGGCAADLLDRLELNQTRIPTVILTGEPDLPALQKRLSRHNVQLLSKPASRAELHHAASRAIDQNNPRRYPSRDATDTPR